MKRTILFTISYLVISLSQAQEDSNGFVSIDTPLTIDLEANDHLEDVEVKKKKRKKRVFYGVKTRKGYTKTGFGERTTYELFHVLKEHQEPDSYIRDVYWYDYRRGARRDPASDPDRRRSLRVRGGVSGSGVGPRLPRR